MFLCSFLSLVLLCPCILFDIDPNIVSHSIVLIHWQHNVFDSQRIWFCFTVMSDYQHKRHGKSNIENTAINWLVITSYNSRLHNNITNAHITIYHTLLSIEEDSQRTLYTTIRILKSEYSVMLVILCIYPLLFHPNTISLKTNVYPNTNTPTSRRGSHVWVGVGGGTFFKKIMYLNMVLFYRLSCQIINIRDTAKVILQI